MPPLLPEQGCVIRKSTPGLFRVTTKHGEGMEGPEGLELRLPKVSSKVVGPPALPLPPPTGVALYTQPPSIVRVNALPAENW